MLSYCLLHHSPTSSFVSFTSNSSSSSSSSLLCFAPFGPSSLYKLRIPVSCKRSSLMLMCLNWWPTPLLLLLLPPSCFEPVFLCRGSSHVARVWIVGRFSSPLFSSLLSWLFLLPKILKSVRLSLKRLFFLSL